ncbi:hypothetical protein PFICI_02838 [Pestalotiopsis fici W106-1]|uniref:FAD/NAD(P)-binding domain-containing protein n=1 Tax=Pestalotiopsis fici (strain W106-1 / CGMCC3.15140) TaxID=1229662 RepID=W3XFE2_PESFW|nr:uncharacterized protein PFICI_02838 [Pestalotiopsis fici W106-1]ETS84813.1 hypothetical protein PFICI_02838 [Pestalotiopsis fici W106-1]
MQPFNNDDQILDAIIIGAGFGGCYLLHSLRQQGFRAKLFEESDGLGGVWQSNCYPGARVDCCTPFYEFSDPEIWAEWEWTEAYPSQKEILRYFEFVDKKWNLSKDITFGARVIKATFIPEQNRWVVQTNTGHCATARFLLPAVGFASKTYTPRLEGLETFKGFACHTAKWPKQEVNLQGKRVGVIGTGASGVQVIQELGPIAQNLVVFQRSPNCALPMRQKTMTPELFDKSTYPEAFRQMRLSFAGTNAAPVPRRALDDSQEQRQSLYERLWQEGGFAPCHGNYSDFSTDIHANHIFYKFWRDKVRQRLHTTDPELIENLAPTDPPYPFGTKRPSLEQNFYEVFNQDNVSLIPLLKNPIKRIVPDGVLLADGTAIELDALVLATGFDAITGSYARFDINGLEGRRLADVWKQGTRTALGMATSGFPNMFFLYGPQSPTASAAGPVTSEIQGDWIIKTMLHMKRHGLTRVEAKCEAEVAWAQHATEECYKTLLPLNETTWYMGGNIPGKKKEALHYVGGLPRYSEALDACTRDNWSKFVIT